MTDRFDNELISALLDGELTAEEQSAVEQVLNESDEHRRMYDELRALRNTLQSLPVTEPDEDLTNRILRQAERTMLTHREASPADRAVEVSRPADEAGGTARWRATWLGLIGTAAVILVIAFAVDPTAVRELSQAPANPRGAAEEAAADLPADDLPADGAADSATSADKDEDDRSDKALDRKREESEAESMDIQPAPARSGQTLGRAAVEDELSVPALAKSAPATAKAGAPAEQPVESLADRVAPTPQPPGAGGLDPQSQAQRFRRAALEKTEASLEDLSENRAYELTLSSRLGDVDRSNVEKLLRDKQLELADRGVADVERMLKRAEKPDSTRDSTPESFEPDMVVIGTLAQVREALSDFSDEPLQLEWVPADESDPVVQAIQLESLHRRFGTSRGFARARGGGDGGGGFGGGGAAANRAVQLEQRQLRGQTAGAGEKAKTPTEPPAADARGGRAAEVTREQKTQLPTGKAGKNESISELTEGLAGADAKRRTRIAPTQQQMKEAPPPTQLRLLLVILPDESEAVPTKKDDKQ